MFEQEMELEKRESSVLPLLLIVAFIIAVVGFAGYYVVQSRKVLSAEEATRIATAVLKNQGPAIVKFHTGPVKSSVNDSSSDPHYKLLEKAGLIKLGKPTGTYGMTIPVALTPKGEDLLKQIQGVTTKKESDGEELYVVPLAERKLIRVSEVKMQGPSYARVNIIWTWETNALGELFDAAGPMVKSFSTYDRGLLIQKHGAAFYHEPPTEVSLALAKTDKGWQIATD